jgi:hypothetical protein
LYAWYTHTTTPRCGGKTPLPSTVVFYGKKRRKEKKKEKKKKVLRSKDIGSGEEEIVKNLV